MRGLVPTCHVHALPMPMLGPPPDHARRRGMDLNSKYLLMLPLDDLLYNFRRAFSP